MKQGKAKIKLGSDSSARGATLLPIVRYCLNNGARFRNSHSTVEQPFVSDRSGIEICVLISDCTVQEILNLYLLPDNITHGKSGLWDAKNSVELSFITPEKHEELERKRIERREKREKRRIARKAILEFPRNKPFSEEEA